MGTFGHEGGGALNDDQRDALRNPSPRARSDGMPEPEAMHGAADGFGGSDFPTENSSEMQHVASSVLRRGRAQANQYDAELVVIAIEREPRPDAVLEGLPDPRYGFGYASTSDDSETIALALRAISRRLERA